MATALYVVILSRGQWYVDLEGKAHGPYSSREAAALEGRQLAQFTAHLNRPSEVLVPDNDGKYWVVWSSARENGVAKPVGGVKSGPVATSEAA